MRNLPDFTVSYAGAYYTFRRNPGENRWQVFKDQELTPAGYVEARSDPDFGGEPRFFVFDAGNRPIGDESVHSVLNILSHLRSTTLDDQGAGDGS